MKYGEIEKISNLRLVFVCKKTQDRVKKPTDAKLLGEKKFFPFFHVCVS